jgi:hypothetical protein
MNHRGYIPEKHCGQKNQDVIGNMGLMATANTHQSLFNLSVPSINIKIHKII